MKRRELNERLARAILADAAGGWMRFEGKISRAGTHWLAEIPPLDAMTQGRTREEACAMARDLVETMANKRRFVVTLHRLPGDRFEISGNDAKVLVALFLRRQRERSGLSLAEVATRLGQKADSRFYRRFGTNDR